MQVAMRRRSQALMLSATACLVLTSAVAAGPPPRVVVVLPMSRRTHAQPGAAAKQHFRHLSAAATAWPMSGNTGDTGVFTVPLSLGNPPQTLEAIVDTGSTLTAFTCAGCEVGECGTAHGVFDPDASSSAVRLSCTDADCACGSPPCTCGAGDACAYRRVYAESSSTSGSMVADDLLLPGGGAAAAATGGPSSARLVFGCATHETGSIHDQPAAGIAGLGADGDAGFVDQLVARGAIPGRAFSLCLAPPPPADERGRGAGAGGGALILGPGLPEGLEAGEGTVTAPLVGAADSSYYAVRLASLSLGGVDAPPVDLPDGLTQADVWRAGAILDSGTTFSYLPSPAYRAVVASADGAAAAAGLARVPGADPAFQDVCWSGGALPSSSDVIRAFPNLTLAFAGGPAGPAAARLTLPSRSYLFPHPSKKKAACLGFFDNKADGTILGGITFLDTLVQIDRTTAGRGLARFVPGADCAALGRDAAAGLQGGGGGSAPPPPPSQRGSAAGRRSRTTAWVAVLATFAALMAVGAAVGLLASRRAGGGGGASGGDPPQRSSWWPWARQWESFEGQGTAAGALGLAAPVVAAPAVAAPAAQAPPRPVVVELSDALNSTGAGVQK